LAILRHYNSVQIGKAMEHAEAVEIKAVERYLLGEIAPSSLEEFEEHFFDCKECSEDLRIGTLFLRTTKEVLATDPMPNRAWSAPRQRFQWFRPQYALASCMALLAVICYQSFVLIPKLRITSSPQTLALFSLAELGARDVSEAVIAPEHAKPYVLLVDIPAVESFSNYLCEILAQDGSKVLSVDVSAANAKQPVPIFVPPLLLKPDSYRLVISGRTGDKSTPYREVEHQSFQIR
jgi:Putative zinc-finger